MDSRKTSGTIVVVDDTPANLRLLTDLLNRQGYKVRPVSSAEMGLKTIQAAHPDLILLDINMPQMDGYEVCRRLKQNDQTADIPVIFISALDETWDRVRAFEVGGVDFITKPFQLEEVHARIRTQLDLKFSRDQLDAAVQKKEAWIQDLERSFGPPLMDAGQSLARWKQGKLSEQDALNEISHQFDRLVSKMQALQTSKG